MNFIMLINVKIPRIVGILTFISTINTTSESLKARKVFCCFAYVGSIVPERKIIIKLTGLYVLERDLKVSF